MQTSTETQPRLDPNKWLDCHGDYLFRYALMRVRDAAVAEDLLQETLLAAIGSHHTHAGRSSERTWLGGIMKPKGFDYFRRTALTPQFQLIADTEDDSSENSGPCRGHWREDRKPLSWPVDAGQL